MTERFSPTDSPDGTDPTVTGRHPRTSPTTGTPGRRSRISWPTCRCPLVGFTYVVTVLFTGAWLTVTVIGFPLLAAGLMGARAAGQAGAARGPGRCSGCGSTSRARCRCAARGGFFAQLWTALKDPVGWRTVLYEFMRLPWGIVTFTITLTSLFVLWPVLPFIARGLANADRAMVRGLLSPSDELERRIAELESDRGVVVDTAAADLRRIERDLHDGAQARLVNLAMGLGLAKEKLLEDRPTTPSPPWSTRRTAR